MTKLRNVDTVRKMLAGEHRFQTRTVVGYEAPKDITQRNVGDIWEETSPDGTVYEWEQKKGYKVKRPKNLKILSELREYLNEYPNCYDDCEKKQTRKYTRYDNDIRMIHGMCLNCISRYETNLKVKGEFEEYERKKKLDSLISLFKDAEIEKEVIKESLAAVSYANEDGSTEKWGTENLQSMLEKIDNDFEELKKSMIEPLLKPNLENYDEN